MSDPRLPVGDDVVLEALLREALAQAGEPAPFPVDVREAVMRRVAAVGAVPAAGVGVRQLAGWIAAAAAAAAVILSRAAAHAPSLNEIVGGFGRTTAESAGTAARLGAGASSLAATLGHSLLVVAQAAGTVLAPLARLQPLTAVVVTLSVATMLAVSTFLVARDLRAGGAPKE